MTHGTGPGRPKATVASEGETHDETKRLVKGGKEWGGAREHGKRGKSKMWTSVFTVRAKWNVHFAICFVGGIGSRIPSAVVAAVSDGVA